MASVLFTFLSLVILWTRAFLPQASAESIQCDGSVSSLKPRVFILSDIGGDPDDSMSMVRLLLYSNQLNLRGLCAATSLFQNKLHPEEITRIVDAYGLVVDNLNRHVSVHSQFRSSDEILPIVTSGPKVPGIAALNSSLSEGTEMLIERLEESSDPLYVSIWGGANTLAQALHHIHLTKSPGDAAVLRSRLRVYAISDQDQTGTWIQAQWPDIFYISSMHGLLDFDAAPWTGMNTNDNGFANTTKTTDEWLTPNIRVGPLGAVYPKIEYGMEGDSPSFLWLIQNGLSIPDMPELGGWGGRYSRVTRLDGIKWYGDTVDVVSRPDESRYSSVQSTVWRWRDAMQDDFAARMQWTLNQSISDVAHPPLVNVNGSTGFEVLRFNLSANQSMVLDAGMTCDADHPQDLSQLDFEWFEQPQDLLPKGTGLLIRPLASPPDTEGVLPLNDAGFPNVTLGTKVEISLQDDILLGREWHIVLQVRTRKGPHPIRRYKRIGITVMD